MVKILIKNLKGYSSILKINLKEILKKFQKDLKFKLRLRHFFCIIITSWKNF